MEIDQAKDPKSMSLDALIQQDKKKGGKGGKGKQDRQNTARSGNGKKGPQGGRPRFENMKGGKTGGRKDLFKAKKSGNMISKANERTVQFKNKQYNKDQVRSGKGLSDTPRRNLQVSAFCSIVSF
jgi:hypothetical protein